MSTERHDLRMRAWLANRDPGEAPARLRAAVAAIPDEVTKSRFPGLDSALTAVFGPSVLIRRALLVAALAILALAVVGAVLLLSRPTFPPRGLIAFSTPAPGVDIRVVAADGADERSITETSAFEFNPRWSPDGRTLMFTRVSAPDSASDPCEGQGSIVLYDMATNTERILVTDPGVILAAEWDPSGEMVVFLRPTPPCVLDPNGPAPLPSGTQYGVVGVATRQVTTDDLEGTGWVLRRIGDEVKAIGFDQRAIFSADGRFMAQDLPGRELFAHVLVADTQLSDADRVDLGVGGVPAWSPTEPVLAYVEFVDQPPEFQTQFRDRIVVYDVDTRERRVVGEVLNPNAIGPGDTIIPMPVSWTPDGRSIFWLDLAGAHIVDVSGDRSADLPKALDGCADLQWQPLPAS